jgi:hypothetical protein
MVEVPWPVTNAPGARAQEGAGKLTNVFAERRGDEQNVIWRRAPGAVVFSREPSVGTAIGDATANAVSQTKEMIGSISGDATAVAVGDIV